ncbi:DMT family transporter [Slackia heliotrinireducens]|nr:DMT family transporter [Slackia heliotrinireducens]
MNRNAQARLMFVIAVVIWGSIGIFVRYIPMPSSFIAFARGVIGVAFLLAFMAVRGKRMSYAEMKPELPIMIATGIAIGINWALLFEAYRHTTVAVATLCYYFAPIIVILASPFVLKERLTPRKVVCVLVALLGVTLVSGVVGGAPTTGPAGGNGPLGVAFGLGAALFYGCNMILNKLSPNTDALSKTIVQLSTAALVMVPYLLFTGGFGDVSFTLRSTVFLLIVGIVHTGVAYLLYFAAIRVLPAQTIAVLSYLDPATAIVLSALLLAEPLTALGLIGAVLILGAALVSELPGKQE